MKLRARFRKFVLLALTVSLVVSYVMPPFTAFADAASDMTDINNKYYAAIQLRDCLEGIRISNSLRRISQTAANDPAQLFVMSGLTTGVTTIGKVYKSDDGKLSCGDGPAISTALSTLGYSSGEAWLKDLGYPTVQASQTQCTDLQSNPPSGCSTTTVTFYDVSGDNRMASKIPVQSPVAQYYGYQTVFNSNCSISEDTNGAYTQNQVVQDPSDAKKFIVQPVKVSFASKTVTGGGYNNGNGGGSATVSDDTKQIAEYDYISGGKDNNIACKDLLTKLNDLAAQVALYDNTHPDAAITTATITSTKTDTTAETNAATCSGGALGWLLCPLVLMMDNLNQAMAKNIEGILKIDMLTNSSSRAALQSIWSLLVGIANLLLVVAFLVVIFSQATSIGLSAYGIKKMLPRIIAAAVLINLSFFLCGVLVDISNIIGGAVKSIIAAGMGAITIQNATVSADNLGADIAAWITVLSGALVTLTASVALGFTAFVVPIIIGGAMATLAFFVGIALRLVIVVLLIVIAPVAIAAMILPNTEPLFKKWWSSLIKLLALYPVIMAIMYGCTLVAKIILAGTT